MFALAALCLMQAAPAPAPFTTGDPAPKLAPLTFVRGEPVAGCGAGAITLVEFSGTQCAPCTKAIPHLNALQKQYPNVVVLTVFSEPEPDVRAYLDGPGEATAVRAATDPTWAASRAWMGAALQHGTPTCFLVDAAGKLAWIGQPDDLDIPLAKLVAGTFDRQQEALRQKVEQGAQQRRDEVRGCEDRARAEADRIRELFAAGHRPEALAATEKAATEYRDRPEVALRFRLDRLVMLGFFPDRRDEAFAAGVELAVEASAGGRELDMLNVAKMLQNSVAVAEVKSRDTRLLDLSLPLLCDDYDLDPFWRRQSADERLLARAVVIKLRARAHTLRGDAEAARDWLRRGVELLEAAPANAEGNDTKRRVKLLAEFRAGLAAPAAVP